MLHRINSDLKKQKILVQPLINVAFLIDKHLTPETFQTPFVFGLEKEKEKKK